MIIQADILHNIFLIFEVMWCNYKAVYAILQAFTVTTVPTFWQMPYMVKFHIHARERLAESGATEEEIIATIEEGETFPAKFGRTGFRRNFNYNGIWRGKHYSTKQVEAYAVKEDGNWLVITIITRFF